MDAAACRERLGNAVTILLRRLGDRRGCSGNSALCRLDNGVEQIYRSNVALPASDTSFDLLGEAEYLRKAVHILAALAVAVRQEIVRSQKL